MNVTPSRSDYLYVLEALSRVGRSMVAAGADSGAGGGGGGGGGRGGGGGGGGEGGGLERVRAGLDKVKRHTAEGAAAVAGVQVRGF